MQRGCESGHYLATPAAIESAGLQSSHKNVTKKSGSRGDSLQCRIYWGNCIYISKRMLLLVTILTLFQLNCLLNSVIFHNVTIFGCMVIASECCRVYTCPPHSHHDASSSLPLTQPPISHGEIDHSEHSPLKLGLKLIYVTTYKFWVNAML